ncbi:MAG TPA: SDR family oxidoreductase [Acidimicrobiales bacterium]|jgi:NAD(P)-dependent dehydrogenase (short-subunit alcohol dehydrogenase family)|nr:SDR family oxidoreductase [Acidimicrobiales bacterium]
MEGQLEGRVAIVTGSARGIGRATALAMGAAGAAVAIVDQDGAGAEHVAGELVERGAPSAAYCLDVADGDAMRRAIDDTVARFGRLDILDNNAAAFDAWTADDVDVVSTPIDVWDRTMAINVRGPMLACKYAIPHMLETTGRGCILNISSTSGFGGDVIYVAYSASKAALQALTRSVATSHGPRGIRCNAIATGLVLTEFAERNVSKERLEAYRANRLVPRVGTPDDVAALAVFLASDAAGYITGQTFLVDGGATAHQPWYSMSDIVHPGGLQPDGLTGATVPRD